ncbi:P-loop containing nucleoside triphosphate hydrolase protein [Nemania sp. FL0031]|nr:P-loop containing nucleoside triphosphate hydrolase protein [Nemania sp. FL0031]
MATTNSAGTLHVSENARVQVGNTYHQAPERPETPPEPSFTIPFRRDVDFVEREAILERLHKACLEPASRAALVGLGGVGKSQLAIEHAYRVRDRFKQENKEVWAFWVHAATRARVEESFKAIADTVRAPGRNQPGANVFQLVYQWLQNERHGKWVMVLDSADNPNVFYATDEKGKQTAGVGQETRALWTYLPQSSNGSILITTRSKELASKLTGHQKDSVIEVGPMDQAHALELLASKLRLQYDRDDGMKLVEALECMPLAISQAAAYIQNRAPRISVKKYLNEFKKNERKKSSLLNHDAGDLRRDESASNSVIATWQISFDYIRVERRSATDLLSLLSFFDSQGILESLVRPLDKMESETNTNTKSIASSNASSNGSEEHEITTENESIASSDISNDEFEENIAMLRNYCLINTNDAGDVFEMHALVQLATMKWLDMHKETENFKRQYIHRMVQVFPSADFNNWGTCRQLLPHAERAIDYCPTDKETQMEWSGLLRNASWYCLGQGRHAIAEIMAEKSYNIRKKVLGPKHLNTLDSMADLALTYREQGRWREAELLGIQALEIMKTVLGPEHPDTLISMANLALTYWNQGRWREAELLGIQALEIKKTVLGPEHPNTLISMVNLALTYRTQGRWREAELLGIQALEIMKTVLGPEHPETLISMSNLAITWKSQGRDHDALQLMEQCAEILIRVIGPEHPHTQGSLKKVQDWRFGEPQTSGRRRKPIVKRARTTISVKFRKGRRRRGRLSRMT